MANTEQELLRQKEQEHHDWAVRWVEETRKVYRGRGKDRAPVPLPPISHLGATVISILDTLYGGIYNAQCNHQKVAWHSDHHIRVCLYGGLSTYDGNRLTRLVLLCHDRAVRLEINGASTNYLELYFHQQERRMPSDETGWISNSHPDIQTALTRHRSYYPEYHGVLRREGGGTYWHICQHCFQILNVTEQHIVGTCQPR